MYERDRGKRAWQKTKERERSAEHGLNEIVCFAAHARLTCSESKTRHDAKKTVWLLNITAFTVILKIYGRARRVRGSVCWMAEGIG